MKRKLSKRKKGKEVILPKELLTPLCDFVLTKFDEDDTVLFRIEADNAYFSLSFNMHIEVNHIEKIKDL